MRTFLGLDYGEARVGLAIATDREKIALPLSVAANDAALMQRLADAVKNHMVTDLVVGWPVSTDGGGNERTKATDDFIGILTKTFSLPVHKSDERFTTELANRFGTPREGSHPNDALAAAAILDSFLTRLP